MELEDIFLARFADLTPDGLFTVVGGGLNRINAARFPWSWGLLFMLARIRLTKEQAQEQHILSVERETPSGHIELIGTGPMKRWAPSWETGPDGRLGLIFSYGLVNLIFPEADVYKYRLRIDGQELGAAELLLAAPAGSFAVEYQHAAPGGEATGDHAR